jgi:hypothetical protein
MTGAKAEVRRVNEMHDRTARTVFRDGTERCSLNLAAAPVDGGGFPRPLVALLGLNAVRASRLVSRRGIHAAERYESQQECDTQPLHPLTSLRTTWDESPRPNVSRSGPSPAG